MSVFGKLFGAGGGKAGKGGPTPQEAIQRLRDTEEMLSKKQEFLEKKIEQELTAAKKHGTKNKRGEAARAPSHSSLAFLRLPQAWTSLCLTRFGVPLDSGTLRPDFFRCLSEPEIPFHLTPSLSP